MSESEIDPDKEKAFDLLEQAARQLWKSMGLANKYSPSEYSSLIETRSEISEFCFGQHKKRH
ncbi:hypothetical protein, partial [Neokomagataea anthophila]